RRRARRRLPEPRPRPAGARGHGRLGARARLQRRGGRRARPARDDRALALPARRGRAAADRRSGPRHRRRRARPHARVLPGAPGAPPAPPPAGGARPRRAPLPPTVVWLGVVSFLTDASSDLIYPLLPRFLSTVLGASAAFVGAVEGVAEATASLFKLLSGRL